MSRRIGPSPEALERRRLSHVWRQMIQRCHNPEHPRFSDYGGRGITVCDRWRGSRAAFLADIGPRPAGPERWTLDRIDGAQGYAPGNVRWATYTTQNRNRRRDYGARLRRDPAGRFEGKVSA